MDRVVACIIGSLVALVALLGFAAPANAVVGCSYDAATRTVTVNGDSTARVRAESWQAITLFGTQCGTATTLNTDFITVVGDFSAADVEFDVDIPLEDAAGDEIKLSFPGNVRFLKYEDNTIRPTTARVGRSGTTRLVDYNGDGDADITQPNPQGRLEISLVDGADVMSGAGGFAGTTPETGSLRLSGGNGNDDLQGPGALFGGNHNDTLRLGPGPAHSTTLDYSTSALVRMLSDMSGTESGFDGSYATDYYVGFATDTVGFRVDGSNTTTSDLLYGGNGPDLIYAGRGDDVVHGGLGNDDLNGGLGADVLSGGLGNDFVKGLDNPVPVGDGANQISGGAGADTLRGGDGADAFADLQDARADSVACQGGADTGEPDRVDTLAGCAFTPPAASITSAGAVMEGTPASFVVKLDKSAEWEASVRVFTANGSGSAGIDYQSVSSLVTFSPGETQKTVQVPTFANSQDDGTRTFTAGIDQPSPTPAIGTPASASQPILDDDTPAIAVSLNPAAPAANGQYATPPSVIVTPPGNATATRCVVDPPSTPASFAAIPAGTCAYAVAGGAKLRVAGQHRLCAASTTQTDETAVQCVTWTTTAPSVYVAAAPQVTEGSPLNYTLMLTWVPATPPSLTVATANGTAVAGTDYTPVSRTVLFAQDAAAATVAVPTIANTLDDGARSLMLNLSAPSPQLMIATPSVPGTILDDDTPDIALSLNPAAPPASGQYATPPSVIVAPPANATATRCVVDPGSTPASFAAIPAGTCAYAAAGGAKLRLAGQHRLCAASTTPSDQTAVECVTWTTTAPSVSASAAQATEGGALDFLLTLSWVPATPPSLTVATANGTAVAGTHYTAVSRTATFAQDAATATVSVPTTANTADDGTRTLTLNLSNPAGPLTIATPSATGTILDDDKPVLGVALNPAAPPAGGAYPTPPSVTVTPPGNATATRCVVDPATTPASFAAIPAGTCAFAAAGGSKVLAGGQHRVCAASTTATDETTVQCATWTTTPPAVSIAGAQVVEGATLNFVLSLSWAPSPAPSVSFATVDGTAKAGTDFTTVSRTVAFAAGATTATVAVATAANDADQAPRSFTGRLTGPSSGLTIAAANATGTITDDDLPVIAVALDPAQGDQPDGAYSTPPSVKVTAPALATETRCVTDPVDDPATFAAIPAGACAYTGEDARVDAPGPHRVCAAARTSTPEDTAVRCVSWTTAPRNGDAVVLGPDAPQGTGGWYTSPPNIVVTAPDGASETRCVLDPATPPARFSDLPEGACAYLGAGKVADAQGAHTLCVASRFGTTETDVSCRSWQTDTVPPVVTCQSPVPTFTAGDQGKLVAAAVADATSGPATAVVTAAADTRVARSATVALKGTDRAGLATTALCRYEVAPLVLCGQDVTILDIVGSLKSVRVAGVALEKYAGQTVAIYAGTKQVGAAKVAPDGSFAATVKPPSKAQRSTVRYQAAIGTARSPALKLERKLRITGRNGLKVTGRIDVPRKLLPKRITFYRKLTCTQQKVFTTVKVRRNGTFTVTLVRPVAPEAYALFRVSAKLGKGRTYTLPIAVR